MLQELVVFSLSPVGRERGQLEPTERYTERYEEVGDVHS